MSKHAVSEEEKLLRNAKLLFGTIYFVQGMGGLPGLAWNYFMKYQMKLSDVQGQIFESLTALGWYIKPLWGYISDRYPLFGYHRKSYMILMPFIASISWLSIALVSNMGFIPYILMLSLFNLGAIGYAFTDVVGDGYMVTVGKRLGEIGSLVRLQWSRIAIASAIVAVVSSVLTTKIKAGSIRYSVIFALTALMPLCTMLVVYFTVSEEKISSRTAKKTRGKNPFLAIVRYIRYGFSLSALRELRRAYSHLWYTALFIFFFGFSPSVGYIMFSFQEEVLKFEPYIFATIEFFSSVAFFTAILLYGRFVRRFPGISWSGYLYVLTVLSVVTLPLSFYYFIPESHWLAVRIPFPWDTYKTAVHRISAYAPFDPTGIIISSLQALLLGLAEWNRFHWFALINTIVFGIITIPGFLIPLTLAGEVAPKGKEATVYALYMSISNGAKFISAFLGGQLAAILQWTGLGWFSYSWLDLADTDTFRVLLLELFIYLGAGASLCAIPFIYLLQRELRIRNIVIHLVKS